MTTAAELDALIEELTVDAYNDESSCRASWSALRKRSSAGSGRASSAPRSRCCVDCGPDARTGLTAGVLRDGAKHEVALADLTFAPGSELGVVVSAYRRWQGR